MKELLIVVCYVNIEGLTRQQAETQLLSWSESIKEIFKEDDDVNDHYMLKTFTLPSDHTKMEVIYPVKASGDLELRTQILKFEEELLKDSDPDLVNEWKKLTRVIKLRGLMSKTQIEEYK